MSLLEITGLSHSFGDNELFHETELILNKGEHIGITGQNGTGKSTLIKICTEEIIPDKGRVVWQPGIKIGYLDQYASIDSSVTMKAFLKTAFEELYIMEKTMNELYDRAAQGQESALKAAAKYQEILEQRDFYRIDSQIDLVCQGLGLSSIGLTRPIGEMSGGQRAKVIMAKLLIEKPDVLLLDEPTNFLDHGHIVWLQDYLCSIGQAFIIISHDEGFLTKTTNWICDIDHKKIVKYFGSYGEFLKKKIQLRENYTKQYSAQQKEIKKTEEFIRKNIAGRKSKMARGRQKQLDHMERLEALEQKEIRPFFRFDQGTLSSAGKVKVSNLTVGYSFPVLTCVNFSMKEGEKVVITGFNGVGKSTLLKTMMNEIPALSGGYCFSAKAVIGYYEQDQIWEDDCLTPIEIVSDHFPSLETKEVRKKLALNGISGKHAQQPIRTLSGGEQAKVKLCLLAGRTYNFLILDEPTNHLDVQAKLALKAALSEFPGTVLLVSHEVSFYKDWVDRVIDISSY
ncbi:ABC transporter ATP-binding protein [Lacrimispora amygdalina]|uniref:ABC transporter ATP-binding protein n=1 Tax=Lacrimispora amygdalina TaxID=253257 RepID=A0A3E2NFE4_9FIRM|nr:ABC-F family ATP-binding cassette domain-containing protein [Clostridium indicum]RFZ79732.1 ABC transporter ATP-binding protein [Clostridium indicum]